MPERLLIGPGSPPSLDPVYPELSPPLEPCHTKSFAGIAGCRNSRNLYFFLPRARPVPVKSGADGGPPRSTEVVLNEQPLPVAWRSQRGGVVRAVMDPDHGNVVGLCRSMRRQRAEKPPEGVVWGIEAHPKYRLF